MEQVKGALAIGLLSIVLFFTYRTCSDCWEAFVDDMAGVWVTTGEALSAIAWSLIALDALLSFLDSHIDSIEINIQVLGLIFWIAFIVKAVSTVIKAKGYRIIRDTYRGFR